MAQTLITYEQPLNELIRVCLRLEHLFRQLDFHRQYLETELQTRVVMKLIIDLINVLDRPDLKSKLSKEFQRLSTYFSRLASAPEISSEMLTSTQSTLKGFLEGYLGSRGKIAENLRSNEFLLELRQDLLNPGGDSPLDSPQYYHWLNQSNDARNVQINAWIESFSEIKAAIETMLDIVRTASEAKETVAEKGFYHQPLDAQIPNQLIRVAIDPALNVYPEISAGKYRVSIRFMIPSTAGRPKQTTDDVELMLTCCAV